MSTKQKKVELWKQKVGHTHGMITQWEGSKYKNFSLVRYWKDKQTDEWRSSNEINVENFADVVELVRQAGEFLKSGSAPSGGMRTPEGNRMTFADDDIAF